MIFAKHFCQALTSSPLPSSDIPAFDAHQHVSGSEIFESSARSNKQSRNVCVAESTASFGPWSSTSSPLHVSSYTSSSGTVCELCMCTSAASQLCCLAVVVGLPKFCCGFSRYRAPLGRSRQTLWWTSCASFGSLSCTSSKADSLWFPSQHPELDHTLPPHEISTWRSTLPKSVLRTLTTCYHVLAKNELVCEPLVDTTFEKLGEHEWRNGVQKMTARVNVTSESALLPLCSHCPLRPSSTGAEPTMLQATWREQAHRARTPLRSTCFAAAKTGPQGLSFVKSRFAGHGTRVMSRRNASAHHLRQFVPHSNNSIKLRIIKCF